MLVTYFHYFDIILRGRGAPFDMNMEVYRKRILNLVKAVFILGIAYQSYRNAENHREIKMDRESNAVHRESDTLKRMLFFLKVVRLFRNGFFYLKI